MPAQAVFEGGNGGEPNLQTSGQVAGLGDAVASKIEKPLEAVMAAQTRFDSRLELFELGLFYPGA